ncbi:hypothetical protein RO3G_02931 [Rhizopus delemar RA 99-880]|uniref:Uncharacterized protein n=1 Tax=Rhizopus delemar (strain RA 99-880 / ATCC MYA-4621 / FGSC 9543 / NRRL 43880) TaxID=246409 RepID=I1BPU7_RHIO9|nr:hypothetical protein RO3G_02931 [Rhizopus delemar RA 99-880]|eukprot:EIE78227.1 hypothetical protein RO3G_02931 [Rhizopus delemar RA 99-880]
MASIWTFDGTVASIFIVSTLSINPEDNDAYQKQICSEELTYFEAQKDQYEMVTEKARTKQKKPAQKIFNIPSKHEFIVY